MKPFDDPERVHARNPVCIRELQNLIAETCYAERTVEERRRSLEAFLDIIEIPLRDLYNAAQKRPDVFEPVASTRESWPVLMTLHPGQHDHVRDTLNSIRLGKCYPIRQRPKDNRGPQIWEWSSDRNQVAKGWLDGGIVLRRLHDPRFAELPEPSYCTARRWARTIYRQMLQTVTTFDASSSPLCSADDFADLPAFAARLRARKRLVDKWFADQCPSETKAAIEDYRDAECDPDKVLAGLLGVLHRILRGSSFYSPKRFTKISLRPETKALLSAKPKGSELVRLNWLLLEDAYPVELSRYRLYPGYGYLARQLALFDKPSAKGKSKAKRENAAISSLEKCIQALVGG